MIEKEYYRVDELQYRFGLSSSDFSYLVETSKIDLAFYIKQNKFVIGNWSKDNGFVGYGVVLYRGLIKIGQSEQLKIIAGENVRVKNVVLLNKELILAHDIEYPFESELPHSFLHSWKPKKIEQISWATIPAKLFPKEQEDSIRAVGEGLNELLSSITGKEPVNGGRTGKLFKNRPEKEFYSAGIELSLDDICLLHTDLVKAGVIKQTLSSPHDTEIENVKTNSTPSRKDDFYELLLSLVENEPEYTAKQYWRLLESESNEMEGFRVHDKYNLLIEVTGNYIKWRDRSGKPRSQISFNAFSNRLTKVRKEAFP